MKEPLLSVTDLTVSFDTKGGRVSVLSSVSFDIGKGETLALVGESGSGKSMTALSILRLIASPPGHIESGSIRLEGRELFSLSEKEMQSVRGRHISMIFQEPMTSLNPVYTIGSQVSEILRLHGRASRAGAFRRAVELLELVGIPSPAERAKAYPHELSGGMRQRVMIAMALACEPMLLIADEPTTALDVTIQAQILDLLRKIQQTLGMSVLFITHDLGVVAEFASRVAVLYAGRIVECGSVASVFESPQHPYTRGLLDSIPTPDAAGRDRPRRLNSIEGMVPSPFDPPPGCRFAPRCKVRRSEPEGYERCDRSEPPLSPAAGGGSARCYYPGTAA